MAVSSIKPAAKNGLLNICSATLSALGRSAAFLIGPALLAPDDFGIYAYLSWIAAVSAQLGSAGFAQSAQRFRSRFAGQDRALSAFLMGLALLATALVAGLLLVLPNKTTVGKGSLVALALLSAIVTSASAVQQALSQAKHDFVQPLRAEGGSQVGRLAGLALLETVRGITPFALLAVDAIFTSVKLLILRLRRNVVQAASDLPAAVQRREIVGYSLSIAFFALMDILVWQRGEIFFLNRYSAISAAAHFAVGSQLTQLIALAPTAALTSLLPRLSEKAYQGKHELDEATSLLVTLATLLALPLYTISLIAVPAILTVWKPAYATVGDILPQLMIGKVVLVLTSPLSIALYASGREKAMLPVACSGGLVALISDSTLIHAFGLTGAAWACALNQAYMGLATYFVARRHIRIRLHLCLRSKICIALALAVEFAASLIGAHQLAIVLSGVGALAVLIREPFISKQLWGVLRVPAGETLAKTNV